MEKNKKRFYILIGGVVLLIILSYKFTISKTFALRKEYRSAKIDKGISMNVSKKLQVLHLKQSHYDSILSQFNLRETSMENNLLRSINTQSELLNVRLREFNSPHVVEDKSSRFSTYHFTLEGSFVNILRLLYEMEKDGVYGEITHLEFIKQKDFRSKKTLLTAKVFIQTIQ